MPIYDNNGTSNYEVYGSELNLLATPTATWKSYKNIDASAGGAGTATATVSDTSPYLSAQTVYASYVTAGCLTKTAIDFSGYTKLKITGYFHGDILEGSGYWSRARCDFGCSTNNTISTYHNNGTLVNESVTWEGGKLFFTAVAYMSGTFTYDISDLNGKYYLKLFSMRGGLAPSSSFEVTAMVLE